ncbi:DMT family transporter [Rubrivirga sp.]|uniref:DMT family transporter n=1 Tax=Rubrivirga sp. TaxID=1885344 RepID=UPI003B528D1D
MGRAPAHVWVLVGAGLLAIGSSPILIRLAGDAPALTLAAWRTLAVTAVFAPVALVRSRAEVAAFSARDWALVLGAGVLLGLHFMAWIVSVQLTSIASASVLVTTSPVFIAVLGAVFLSERPSRRTSAAIAVAVVGAVLIGLSEGDGAGVYPNPALGNSLALGAAIMVSIYLLIGRSVRQRTSFVAYFALLNGAAAVTCVVGCVVAGVPLGLSWPVAGLALAMGIGPGLIGHGSFAYALKYLPAALIGLLSLAEPVFASTVALVAFGEVPTALGVVGMAVVLASIAAVVTSHDA